MASNHYVFSDDLKEVISRQNSCHNDPTEMASPHYVFSDDLQDVIYLSCVLQY